MTLPKRPRVLIAEDHPGMAKAVCRLLALDCDVVGNVPDGRLVLEAADRLQPDVVVVDLNLPHVHGLDVCRQITHENPHARVVVFSAMNDPDMRERCVEAGASAFVCKGTGDLLSTIKRLWDDEADPRRRRTDDARGRHVTCSLGTGERVISTQELP